ncbi:MAG: ABC transporter permease [Puniceicoccaceae bacterium]
MTLSARSILNRWPLWLGIGFVLITVGYPVGFLFLQSLFPNLHLGSLEGFGSDYLRIFQTEDILQMIVNSVLWASATTVVSWVLGIPAGWLLARTNLPAKPVARIILLIPVMAPAYINALAYILVMQQGGFADSLPLGVPEWLRDLFFGFWGVTFVMAIVSFGAVALATEAILRSLPNRLEDAASSLGASRGQVLRWILIPLLLPAILNAGILVFLEAIANFGVPAILGPRANLPLLPAEIYHLVTSWPIDFPLATALSGLLCVIAILLVTLSNRILSRQALIRSRIGAIREKSLSPSQKVVAWLYFGFLFAIGVAIPNAAIVFASLVESWNAGALPSLTFANYIAFFAPDSRGVEALQTSLLLSVGAATVCTLVGGIASYAIFRYPGPTSRFADVLGLLPRVVPNIVVAIAFIMAWNAPWILLEIYNTIWILFLAYLALYQSDALRYGSAGMSQVGKNLEDAAASLGANRFQILRMVVFPLLRPSLFVAWALTFVVCMRDWVASIILLPPGVETVGSYLFNEFDQGNLSNAMVMATLTVLLSSAVLLAIQRKPKV